MGVVDRRPGLVFHAGIAEQSGVPVRKLLGQRGPGGSFLPRFLGGGHTVQDAGMLLLETIPVADQRRNEGPGDGVFERRAPGAHDRVGQRGDLTGAR